VPAGDAPDVTILVPALNEQETIAELVGRLLALPVRAQIIVIDDGSTDRTSDILRDIGGIEVITHAKSQGKGAAIRVGLARATGRAVVIQDADLEYIPEELPALVGPILRGEANVVYGTRFSRGLHPDMMLPNKVVNLLLVWAVRLLYGRRITDEATCYKAFRRDLLQRMNLVCRRFEFCPEVTAKAIRLGERIVEVPISYSPRGHAAGKKIRWTDAPAAFWTLLRHRFGRF
jgi:glycosyltransferase involved in cell wall biosynthesis